MVAVTAVGTTSGWFLASRHRKRHLIGESEHSTLGFFVDPFQKPSQPSGAGRDYTPPANGGGYKPLINLHNNHSNLEGNYDPRLHLDQTLPPYEGINHRRRDRVIALIVVVVLVVCAVALFGLYLSSV